MSAAESRTACVTGGNGYIASALIKMLLEKGYAVKTTVRNPDDMEKNSHLKDLQARGPLKVLRADLDEEGSFDEAVAGCDQGRSHVVAGGCGRTQRKNKEVIETAVRGTLHVMRSCVKAGTVKRVILTSSAAAVTSRPLQGDGQVLDEESWSDVEHLKADKKSPVWAYPISKVLSEKEACKFAQENNISLVTLCPVLTVGVAPAPKVNTSVAASLSFLSGDETMIDTLKSIQMASGSISMVHVDDLCRAELFVAEEESASGRYICCSLDTTVVELACFLAAKYPQYNVKIDRFGDLPDKPRVRLSSEKLVRDGFEFKYKTLDEIYDDVVVEYGKALGILPY